MRPIDADALKDKLQQHHDFYVMAWGGFGKMPIGEKKRVDEITNCIAEVVNAPTIEPKQGEWIEHEQGEWIKHEHGFWTFVNDKGERDGWIPDYECNLCGSRAWRFETNFCPNCGAQMKGADNTPQITMCRDCDDYAGDGMYCASNFLAVSYNGESVNVDLRRKADRHKGCWLADTPQPETEIAKAIVHKMIDDAVIAEDAYPDLRQKMHDAVDEYEPQTGRRLPDYSYEADLAKRLMEQTEGGDEGKQSSN